MSVFRRKNRKIFERFYQAESGHEGSGIGLSLVQRLVELHHGHITLESKVGEGSTFSIYIPQDKSMYTSEELLAQEEGPKSSVHIIQMRMMFILMMKNCWKQARWQTEKKKNGERF